MDSNVFEDHGTVIIDPTLYCSRCERDIKWLVNMRCWTHNPPAKLADCDGVVVAKREAQPQPVLSGDGLPLKSIVRQMCRALVAAGNAEPAGFVATEDAWVEVCEPILRAALSQPKGERGSAIPETDGYRANFLWPHGDDSVNEAGYEFANARTEEYRKQWWEILLSRAAQPKAEVGWGDDLMEAIRQGIYALANADKHAPCPMYKDALLGLHDALSKVAPQVRRVGGDDERD